MRSANILTVAGAALAGAGLAQVGVANAGPAPRDVSQHINTIRTLSTRQAGAARSVAVAGLANAHICSDPGSCDEAQSVVKIRATAPVESATHCICHASGNGEHSSQLDNDERQAANWNADIAARAPNDTSAPPPEVTGGALPQQMQASMAGLLGFFIMSLVML
ncbi:hypothetical protein HJFPF1_06561 [Paramyrothecium foliicola]|nr:hypothetical protein HJFPF1_06561 [Paramyrothecium foliicola]